MATSTTNLGLTKPSVNDAADIAVLNSNFDKIDEKCNPALFSPSGYGLGLTGSHLTALTDANEAQRNGWYLIDKDTTNGIGTNAIMRVESEAWAHCVQTAYAPSYSSVNLLMKCRYKSSGTWSAWANCGPSAFAPAGASEYYTNFVSAYSTCVINKVHAGSGLIYNVTFRLNDGMAANSSWDIDVSGFPLLAEMCAKVVANGGLHGKKLDIGHTVMLTIMNASTITLANTNAASSNMLYQFAFNVKG